MSLEMLPLFTLTIFILAIIPGPGVLLTVAKASVGGIRHASFTIAGILVGDIIFILLVTLGLKFVAESLSTLFIFIKYAGSAYLIWLGLSLLFSPPDKKLKLNEKNTLHAASKTQNTCSFFSDFLAGVAVTLSNPKAIVFYLSFFPAFMNIPMLTLTDITVITFIITLVIGSAMMLYAIAAIRTQESLATNGSKKWMKKIAGGIIVSTGGWLLIRN